MRGPFFSPAPLTAADRALASADAKMTAARLQPWMRPAPQPVVMTMRARGLGLLAQNDEPELSEADRALAAQFAGPADLQLVDNLRALGGL